MNSSISPRRPGPAQIRNSNSYSIAAQVRRAGGVPKILPVAKDREESIREGIRAAMSSDLLVLSGGVSMGKYDLVENVLAAEGAEFHMTGARIQPGKPVVFGTLPLAKRKLPFFGLPGNPISTMVTFDLFVVPVLQPWKEPQHPCCPLLTLGSTRTSKLPRDSLAFCRPRLRPLAAKPE